MPGLHPQLVAPLLALALAACGSAQRYADLPEKNLRVRTLAVGATAVMSVHRLDDKCFAHGEGAITLDRPVIEVGLPAGRMSLLVFDFYSLSAMPGGRLMRREARLLPREGYRYEARVTYKDAIYGADLVEIDPGGAARELESGRAAGCK
jgi:hypothetical protein